MFNKIQNTLDQNQDKAKWERLDEESSVISPEAEKEEDSEIRDDELESISGGLNPQPIPPGRWETFAGSSGTGKTISQFGEFEADALFGKR